MFCAVPAFTWVAKLISFELFSEWVSDALITVKEMLVNNEALSTYVYGDNADAEIKKIKEDAERFKDEDEKKRKELEKINQAQSYLNGVESALKDESMSSSFSDDEKSTIKEKVEALNKALDNRENIEDIEKAREDLEKTFTPIITRIYQNMQNTQDTSKETASADGPQDVSFEEVK